MRTLLGEGSEVQILSGTLNSGPWFAGSADRGLFFVLSQDIRRNGEYKSLLNTLEFDAGFFLDSIILTESRKSTAYCFSQLKQGTSLIRLKRYTEKIWKP